MSPKPGTIVGDETALDRPHREAYCGSSPIERRTAWEQMGRTAFALLPQ